MTVLVAIAAEVLPVDAPLVEGCVDWTADCGHDVIVAPTSVALIEAGEIARVLCTGCAVAMYQEHGVLNVTPRRSPSGPRPVTRRELRLARLLRVAPPKDGESAPLFRAELNATIIFALIALALLLVLVQVAAAVLS